jgi:hypothetical protein
VLPPRTLKSDALDCLEQAKRNLELSNKLRQEGLYLEWAATALLYSAVMLIDAHALEVRGMSIVKSDVFENHSHRFEYVKLSLSRLRIPYERLFDLSIDTRYRLIIPTEEDFTASYLPDYEAVRLVIGASGVKW